jgi:hypothetical protein
MALSITPNFTEIVNSVVPLALGTSGVSLRVASLSSSVLGSLTASTSASSVVSWSMQGNPSWITLSVDSTSLVATLTFSNAQPGTTPYQFFVVASDGINDVDFPIFLEVKDPFSIVSTSASSTFSINSSNAAQPDLVFQGVGLNGVQKTGVCFIPPQNLPTGLNAVTSNGSSLKLRVAAPTLTNPAGGLQLFDGSAFSTQLTLKAYCPGTMYDNPDRCYLLNCTLESLLATTGTIDFGVGVSASGASTQLTLISDYLHGVGPAVTAQILSGGQTVVSATTPILPSSASYSGTPYPLNGNSITTEIINTATGAILASEVLASSVNFPVSAGAWNASTGLKLAIGTVSGATVAPQTLFTGFSGTTQTIAVSALGAQAGDTVTVTLSVVPAGSTESAASLSVYTLTLAGTAVGTFNFSFPFGSPRQKWEIRAAAVNALTGATRCGFAQAVAMTSGDPLLYVSEGDGTSSLTASTGTSLTTATAIAATVAANGTRTNVGSVTFELINAPDGLFIDSGTGILSGSLRKAGTYQFSISATGTNYAAALAVSPTVSQWTLTVTQQSTELVLSSLQASTASSPDNQAFALNWGYTGTPLTLNLIQNYSVRSVIGTTSATASQVGSSVFTIYGTSFYGDAYSVPTVVISSSVLASGQLSDAPTVGSIDQNYNFTLNWTPYSVNGGYSVYKGWDIYLRSLPSGVNELQTVGGSLPTGLEVPGATADSRVFVENIGAGDWAMTMQAITASTLVASNSAGWDTEHQFPAALNSSFVTSDNATISLGETLNISLAASYVGADTWSATYPDGTTSGWLPLSVRTIAKTFSTFGPQTILVQTQYDYSKNTPPVKLRRQFTLPIYVMDQSYVASTGSDTLTGNLGIGGSAGFEVTDASSASVALEPYEVLVRALVRDTVTNELKLMVASSRTTDASSLLGTMAIDVFPISGRPRVRDLVDPGLYLQAVTGANLTPTRIATTALPNLIVGKPMSDYPLQVSTNSGVAPYSWYADSLPFGIKLSTNGTMSGTATAVGVYAVDVVCVDSSVPPYIANAELSITVATDLAIVSAGLPNATVTTPYSEALACSGGIPPYTWSIVAGAVPVGLVLGADTGILSGTPVTYNSTTDFSKTFTITAQAIDAIGSIATANLSLSLKPASLQFGNLDQNLVFVGNTFEMVLPVFGGTSPYTLASFTDDGTIGNGLVIVNPIRVATVAGVTPPALTITSNNQSVYPASYPYDAAFELTATGGQAPYKFSVVPTGTTLPGAVVSAAMMTSAVTADGRYTVNVQCTDGLGNKTTRLISVAAQQQNSGYYQIRPVQVNLNSSNNPGNWTITPLTALPDAVQNTAYNGGSNLYYGLALYVNGVLTLSQASTVNPVSFSILSGALPTGIVAFSGNSFAGTTDYSGIIVFNVSGGSNPQTLGSYSFEGELSHVLVQGSYPASISSLGASGSADSSKLFTTVVSRFSITVATQAGTSAAVVVTSTASYTLDLTTALSSPYPWYYPLAAEGGKAPYNFAIQSGTTLPGATLTTWNGLPALASSNAPEGSYAVVLTAVDSNGVVSPSVTLDLTLDQTATSPIHIVDSQLPTYVYANRPVAANSYYIDTDINSTVTASNLPAGLGLSSTSGTRAYLQGTPTVPGTYAIVYTATSAAYGTTTTLATTLVIRAQAVSFVNPPTSATLGVAYRVATNNSIVSVQYTGYQPSDTNLPLLTASKGTVGAPGLLSGGSPTTSVSNLTADGFTMSYDFTCGIIGSDLLTIGSTGVTLSLPVNNPALVATGTTVSLSVSEYSSSAQLTAPVTVTGGVAPYAVTLSAFSSPAFTASGSNVVVAVGQLTVGQTTQCTVSMLITDAAGSSTTATGTMQVTVRQETYEQISFVNGNWAFNLSSGLAVSSSYVPNQTLSIPQLGHAPYQYYVDSVIIPSALTGLISVSPSQRVLAVQVNNAGSSATLNDLNASLTSSGTFLAPAVPTNATPPPGVYSITLGLRVVDADALTESGTVILTLTIS